MSQTPSPRRLSSSPFTRPVEQPAEVFVVDARVSHDTYGLGRVLSVDGTRSAQVDFGSGSTYVPLPCRQMTTL